VLARANELKPGDWTVLSAQGVTFDQLGRYADAQAKYAEALKLEPDNPSVLTNLGLSYAIEGNLDDAEQTLRKAVANPRAAASARQNLAVVLGLQGKFDEATRLARADLPVSVADNNIAYLRDMLTQPALWKQMETLDKGDAATH
jgi:Flp pilus assembly protein TadD